MNDSNNGNRSTIEEWVKKNVDAGKKPNRLINEKSPYLLQHAFNPVDWFPWGDEAFRRALSDNKPIFLSVGYSTCYWCHVMEREVFENESIAALMNKHLVCIKVDREERPDIDHVYMSALQATTGSGGWPMSIFMSADRKPFFAATYLPPKSEHGRVGFPELLERIHHLWQNDRAKIAESSQNIHSFLLQSMMASQSPKDVGAQVLDRGFDIFQKSYDATFGGFSPAPKFPRPVVFNFLFRYYSRTRDEQARNMVLETLRKMASGGMYDQIGGGFHRYSTDERWHVPHFEKMLYDQGQLAISYLEAYQITHDDFFRNIAEDTFDYVQRVMTHPEGAFYSAEDAESALTAISDEKKEGAFYVWTKREFESLLNGDEFKAAEHRYDIQEQGNVQSDPRGEFVNENVLYIAHSVEETAQHIGCSVEDTRSLLERVRKKLFAQQSKRRRPHLDDKILVSWNGLMISAFARAYQVLGRPEYLLSATRAGQFILEKMYDGQTGNLLRRFRQGEARFEANLSDYSFLIQGFLDLYESSFEIRWLEVAIELTENQNKLFHDPANGGFFDNSGNDATLLLRSKETYDGAEPSGNSIAILNLLRLSQMVGNNQYRDIAMKALACFGEHIEDSPHGLTQSLVAVEFSLSKPKQIILAGEKNDAVLGAMIKEIHSHFIPNKIVLLADGGKGQKTLASHVPFFGSLTALGGRTTVYVCEEYTCKLPTSDVATLSSLLDRE